MKKGFLLLIMTLFSFSFSQEWQTNFSKTLEEAKASNKTIILVFSGSDWCIPCIKLKEEILEKEEFKKALSNDFVIVNADFPKKKKNASLQSKEIKKQNETLMEKYNPEGYFPYVVLISNTEKLIATHGYENITPKEYAELLNGELKNAK